ncbi:hypothetical protein NLU13_4603 [Sarocladium strictum]|uniref:AAA+ ATPase domain-containing protein n=1 Tax=Sarocladium strictum TaxID=5046 RepID=A0AA39GJ69_SARSR|nr:hypothetical protein NLU13_4603 [Sarocladium strictum]
MDSYLVSTMVQGHHHQTTTQKLHPFFSKETTSVTGSQSPQIAPSYDEKRSSVLHNEAKEDRRKRRKTDGSQPDDVVDATGRSAMTNVEPNVQLQACEPVQEPKGETTIFRTIDQTSSCGTASIAHSSEHNDTIQMVPVNEPLASVPDDQKPRKVLKFNMSTGTLGSPPKPKQKQKLSRIVCIKYGSDNSDTKIRISTLISQILDGTLQLPVTPAKKRPKRSRAKRVDEFESQITPATPAHPFFSGKPKSQPTTAKPQEATRPSSKPRNTVFLTTPVSPRKPRAPFDASKVAHFGSQRSGVTKVPGAMHAMWPPQGMSHVRGDEYYLTCSSALETAPSRKSKGQVVTVSHDEAVLSGVLNKLDLPRVRSELNIEENFPNSPAEQLRLPKRHFESGRKLRMRIDEQLRSTRSLRHVRCVDGLPEESTAICHPAIASLYKSLETRLSAYDRSTCENAAWTQKYAPASAAEVLQPSCEGPLLKEWLEALKVQSVDTGSSNPEAKSSSKPEKPPKRRKKNKLDGFIVDSDDDADELNCIPDEDDEDSSAETLPTIRTVIRNRAKDSKVSGRLKNAVLISGPHGCGKTAAVYAVAKELDYEIFEINSSSRRSGKDLMEKVGDMTRNHLVQQHRAEKAAPGDGDGETTNEVRSGKQGMMTSFFKPKPGTSDKGTKSKKAADKPADLKSSPPKAQKQSLILVEEVDVLYKEDTQFWAALMGMISQSRRPFILTCNDESLVPTQSLALHGIFRFAPPPTDLAVDLCLLVAANEGHALQRDAVEAAYTSRGKDLRATLLDLNYWCQLGVGDRRGGFDWFLLRWPRGCDVDANGDTVRVVSEDTYTKGMGWIGRDAVIADNDSLDTDEEVMQQLWNLWQVPVGDWQESLDLHSWAGDISASSQDPSNKLDILEAYDDFCEAMSISDLCSDGQFGSPYQQKIDATLPGLPNKMRDDFIIGRQLLEADPVSPSTCSSVVMSQCLASLARRSLLDRTENACVSGAAAILNPLTESSAVSTLNASFESKPRPLTRYDLSLAFDPLAISDRALINSLDPSVFDRTLRLIVLDVAPWVRGIMAYDNRLMQERSKLSSLLSEGGNGKGRKRMRTTRAALSALEGGERKLTRGEKWFKGVGTGLVMRTGGEGWAEVASADLESQAELVGGSAETSDVDNSMAE